jgi:hypothetical protein
LLLSPPLGDEEKVARLENSRKRILRYGISLDVEGTGQGDSKNPGAVILLERERAIEIYYLRWKEWYQRTRSVNVRPRRVFARRGLGFSSASECASGILKPRRKILIVAMTQKTVEIRIRRPSAVFRFSNPNDSIHFQNGSHFSRYRNPQYAKNTMAMPQAFWTKGGIFATGPFRRSHIATAAAKRKGQEDIQLSLESIYSVQKTLPSHWEMA